MKKYNSQTALFIIYIIVIIIPGIILSYLSFLTINKEEAYIEKQLKQSLKTEVSQIITFIEHDLTQIDSELKNTISKAYLKHGNNFTSVLRSENSLLIQSPFLLSNDFKLISPKIDSKELRNSTLSSNISFLTNNQQIPYFQNIVKIYRETIIEDENIIEEINDSEEFGLINKDEEISDDVPIQRANSQKEKRYSVDRSDYKLLGAVQTQAATKKLKESPKIRDEVFKQAKSSGLELRSRNIIKNETTVTKEPSLFVYKESGFGEITKIADSGLIPRFIDDQLRILFWCKIDSKIMGCMINIENFKKSMVGQIPNLINDKRIMTIIDEHGYSLISLKENNKLYNWDNPFLSQEISEKVPGWEFVVDLKDPDEIKKKVLSKKIVMISIILPLFIAMIGGGYLFITILMYQFRLVAKKRSFVTNVSHELKTPLTSIRICSEILLGDRIKEDVKRKKYLSTIVNESERLSQLINNLLDFSKLEKGVKRYNFEKCDINQICLELFENQKIRLEENKFICNFIALEKKSFISIDIESIKQVILNLISNSEKYSDKQREITLSLSNYKNMILIKVKDRGIGVKKENQGKIFKEFYRINDKLTAKANGSGLGLTISNRIIKDHKGEIRYYLRKNGGSIFEIRLPMEGK